MKYPAPYAISRAGVKESGNAKRIGPDELGGGGQIPHRSAEFAAARRQGDCARHPERAHRQGASASAVAARQLPHRLVVLRRAAPRRAVLDGRLAQRPRRPHQGSVDEVNSADLVVMVATAGENVAAAAIIGEACSVKHVMTTALILGGASSSDETISKMLAQLRPHVMMLVISSADEYIKDMLTCCRSTC